MTDGLQRLERSSCGRADRFLRRATAGHGGAGGGFGRAQVYTGPQNGLIVHTGYWEDVEHSGSCQIDVFINRARLVQKVRTKGRCAVVEMAPAALRLRKFETFKI